MYRRCCKKNYLPLLSAVLKCTLNGHFIRYTFLVSFAFRAALIHHGIDSARCRKPFSKIFEMPNSHPIIYLNVDVETETRQCFFSLLLLSNFGDPILTVASVCSPQLIKVAPGIVHSPVLMYFFPRIFPLFSDHSL